MQNENMQSVQGLLTNILELGRGALLDTGKMSYLLISWELCLKLTVGHCELRKERKKREILPCPSKIQQFNVFVVLGVQWA